MKVWYCWAFYRNFGNIGIYFIERLYIFLLKNKTGEQIYMSEKNVFLLFWFIMLLLFALFYYCHFSVNFNSYATRIQPYVAVLKLLLLMIYFSLAYNK